MLTRNDKEFSCKRYDYMRNKHFYLLKNVYAKFSDCHSNGAILSLYERLRMFLKCGKTT